MFSTLPILRILLLLMVLILPTCLVAQVDKDAFAYFSQGEKLRSANDFRGAINQYDRAINADPTNYKYFYQKAVCYSAIRDRENAIRALEQTVSLKPDLSKAYSQLGKLYSEKNNEKEAVSAFDNAFKYETDTKAKLEYKNNIIKLLFQSNNLNEAEGHIKQALALAPNDLNLLYYQAKVANHKKQYSLAINAMTTAVKQLASNDPKYVARFYYELGYAFYQTEQFDKAMKAFDLANYGPYKEKIMTMHPDFFVMAANAYFEIYDLKKTEELLAKITKMSPNNVQAANISAKVKTVKANQANLIAEVKKKISVEQDARAKIKLYGELAQLEFYANDYNAAIKTTEEILRIFPENYHAKFIKAIALYKINKINEALQELEELVQFKVIDYDTRSKYYFAMGTIYKAKKMNDNANLSFKRATTGIYKIVASNEIE